MLDKTQERGATLCESRVALAAGGPPTRPQLRVAQPPARRTVQPKSLLKLMKNNVLGKGIAPHTALFLVKIHAPTPGSPDVGQQQLSALQTVPEWRFRAPPVAFGQTLFVKQALLGSLQLSLFSRSKRRYALHLLRIGSTELCIPMRRFKRPNGSNGNKHMPAT